MTPPGPRTVPDVEASPAIGIFDSGVGGLSVWREVVRQLPLESWQRRGPTFVVDRRPEAALAEQLMEEGWTIAEGSW